MTLPRIAFLGTGIMGRPMCSHLLRAGFDVSAWNRTAAKAASLGEEGAAVTETARAAVVNADIVIVMLSSGPVVTEVLLDDAVLSELAPGSTVIVMSSIPVETSREHAARLAGIGIKYVDAPVSGGEKGAKDATLTIMAGGDADTIELLRPILETMGRVTCVGPVGCGQLAKLANQTIVGITIDAVAEALLLAGAGGADLAAVRDALLGGFADSTILRQHGQRMISGDFEPGGKSDVQLKDLSTSLQLAEKLGLDLPVLRLTTSLYRSMCDEGLGGLDHSGIYRYLETRKTN